jgi:hypothetical protein
MMFLGSWRPVSTNVSAPLTSARSIPARNVRPKNNCQPISGFHADARKPSLLNDECSTGTFVTLRTGDILQVLRFLRFRWGLGLVFAVVSKYLSGR